jgi:hypothetical protein
MTLTLKKNKKSLKKRNYKGGSFGPMSATPLNSNITYELNEYTHDPSREIQSARNLVGGKKKNKTRKMKKNKTKKGGSMPLKYNEYKPILV